MSKPLRDFMDMPFTPTWRDTRHAEQLVPKPGPGEWPPCNKRVLLLVETGEKKHVGKVLQHVNYAWQRNVGSSCARLAETSGSGGAFKQIAASFTYPIRSRSWSQSSFAAPEILQEIACGRNKTQAKPAITGPDSCKTQTYYRTSLLGLSPNEKKLCQFLGQT